MSARENMERLTAGLRTKADKIRRLGAAGYARQQIADFLGIRYQHVRNVLVDAEKMKKAVEEAGLAESRRAWRGEPGPPSPGIRVRSDGAALIPASVLAAAGFVPGDPVVVQRGGDGELHLFSRREALRRAQALVEDFAPKGLSFLDGLLNRGADEAGSE